MCTCPGVHVSVTRVCAHSSQMMPEPPSSRALLLPHPPAAVSTCSSVCLPIAPSPSLLPHHLVFSSFVLLSSDSYRHLSPDGQSSVTVLRHSDNSYSDSHTHTNTRTQQFVHTCIQPFQKKEKKAFLNALKPTSA